MSHSCDCHTNKLRLILRSRMFTVMRHGVKGTYPHLIHSRNISHAHIIFTRVVYNVSSLLYLIVNICIYLLFMSFIETTVQTRIHGSLLIIISIIPSFLASVCVFNKTPSSLELWHSCSYRTICGDCHLFIKPSYRSFWDSFNHISPILYRQFFMTSTFQWLYMLVVLSFTGMLRGLVKEYTYIL